MATTMDDVLETLIEKLGVDLGGTLKARANLTGDDGDGIAEAGDVAQINSFSASAKGIASLGGKDSSGNYKFQFGNQEEAQDFVNIIKGVVKDFTGILTPVGAKGGDAFADTDVVEQLLKKVASAFGGTVTSDANFSADNLSDAGPAGSNFTGPNSKSVNGNIVNFGGNQTSGTFKFAFDDNETATAFFEVANKLLAWAKDSF